MIMGEPCLEGRRPWSFFVCPWRIRKRGRRILANKKYVSGMEIERWTRGKRERNQGIFQGLMLQGTMEAAGQAAGNPKCIASWNLTKSRKCGPAALSPAGPRGR